MSNKTNGGVKTNPFILLIVRVIPLIKQLNNKRFNLWMGMDLLRVRKFKMSNYLTETSVTDKPFSKTKLNNKVGL